MSQSVGRSVDGSESGYALCTTTGTVHITSQPLVPSTNPPPTHTHSPTNHPNLTNHLVRRQVRALLARDFVVPAHHVGPLGEGVVGLGLLEPAPPEVRLLRRGTRAAAEREGGGGAGGQRGGGGGAAAHCVACGEGLGWRPCPWLLWCGLWVWRGRQGRGVQSGSINRSRIRISPSCVLLLPADTCVW